MDCLFCKIAKGEIPAEVVYRDDLIVIFNDISPQAPHHKLIIPIEHIATLNDVHDEDEDILGHMVHAGTMHAKELGISDDGFRIVFNCNAGAGQSVFHIHAHLLGGRQMNWPPG